MRADVSDSWRRLRLAQSATPAEQFSLWAMRLWWSAFPALDTAWPDLARGFRLCTVPSALEACHRFCSVALSAAGCGSGIACLYCPRISALEDKLLEALAAGSASKSRATEFLLRQVMSASAARCAAPQAMLFARAIAQAGLQWPPQPADRDSRFAPLEPPTLIYSLERLH